MNIQEKTTFILKSDPTDNIFAPHLVGFESPTSGHDWLSIAPFYYQETSVIFIAVVSYVVVGRGWLVFVRTIGLGGEGCHFLGKGLLFLSGKNWQVWPRPPRLFTCMEWQVVSIGLQPPRVIVFSRWFIGCHLTIYFHGLIQWCRQLNQVQLQLRGPPVFITRRSNGHWHFHYLIILPIILITGCLLPPPIPRKWL